MSHWKSHILKLVHGGRFLFCPESPAGWTFFFTSRSNILNPFLSFWFGLLGWLVLENVGAGMAGVKEN
jgi:hypothetical protein